MYILVVKVAESDSIHFFVPAQILSPRLISGMQYFLILPGRIFGSIVCDETETEHGFILSHL